MKRKMFFLSSVECDKSVVENINTYFDKGYVIEDILNADCGYYIIMVLNCSKNYDYAKKSNFEYTLLEEKVKTNPENIKSKYTYMNDWVYTPTSKDVNPIYN